MMRRVCGLIVRSLLFLCVVPAALAAQEAVTVTGHVSAASMPLRGATVRIESLNLSAMTDAEGRYSFIVPSTRVRGQTVTLTATHLRHRPRSAEIPLVGGTVVQDFALASNDGPARRADAPRSVDTTRNAPPSRARSQTQPFASVASVTSLDARLERLPFAPIVDSSAFTDVAGATDLASALSGRFAGLEVLSTSAIGGASALFVRGPRTVGGLAQPLIAVNGVLVDNGNITSASQRSGRGGFDYGSAINDLNLEDIASVQLLSGPAAAMRFGGRAANGVLLITTRNGRGLNGVAFSASQQISSSSPLQLPRYQNTYGQGLGGKFSFFDGKGGGINDAVDESWGPRLDGQPLPQASFTEAGRPEVRTWLPLPTNVSDYFRNGRTLATNLAVQGGNETGHMRASLSNRSSSGITPRSSVTRRSAVFTGGLQPNARLFVSGDLHLYSDRGEARPGTGFDESNPVSVFSHIGRQVDVQTYRTRLRDAKLAQLSWNYSGHNNPWFAALENDNHDERTRVIGGGAATLALSDWVTAIARAGTDRTTEKRNFLVASGWMGGFPYYAGRGNFSTGGFQNDDISSTQTTADVMLRAAPQATGPTAFVLTVGAGHRADDIATTVLATDKFVDSTTRPAVSWSGSSSTNILFGAVETRLRDLASVTVSARSEFSSLLSGSSSSTLYPAIFGSIDLARLDSGNSRPSAFDMLAIRGGWFRSGNDATSAHLQRLGVTARTPAATVERIASPELTSGFEVGTTIRTLKRRVGLDVTLYSERTENLLLPSSATFERSGALSNKGVEATLSLVPLRTTDGIEWTVAANFGRNANMVESLSGGVASVPLAPSFGGVSVEARSGSALGALVGIGYLRDASGQLLLRGGRPLPDSISGPRVLGESAPAWIGGLATSFRAGGLEASILFDTHQGGRIFSASNRAGAYSGVLDETLFRPDTGLLIAGIDVATAKPNTKHVSTEDYYHALGAIGERWIYDASFVKLREARVSYTLPLTFVNALALQSVRGSIIARNLALWSSVPNIDPETALSTSTFRGAEMGQLPTSKSLGIQLTLTP